MNATSKIDAAPTALEQSIRDICAAHGLASLSIGFLLPNDVRGKGWTVFAQRWEGDEPIDCWSGDGASIAAALAEAIAQLPVTAELADEAVAVAA